MTKSINLALVGASGVVGTKIIQLLEKKGLAIDNFYPLGNASAGQKLEFNSSEYTINNIDSFDPSKADLTMSSVACSRSALESTIIALIPPVSATRGMISFWYLFKLF